MIHIDTVSSRLFELCEKYVREGLSHYVPLVTRLVEEYKGFDIKSSNCNVFEFIDNNQLEFDKLISVKTNKQILSFEKKNIREILFENI
ncbi:hypothetical protein BpHYR1_042356 [Brachionus plicatilis]|uniref:Uncharacterized protein n=1 Tax=Brachionus plicatilis TaxID=10195 RepID=A0A3M7SV75_BRAPC|nr:hypothetical protein BpHYR1_042356 [Brachionus plicatilis]